MRRRSLSRGFTAIEVLVSLTLLAIGAAGVIAMQKTAVQGQQDARQLDVANAIAREWMERLRRDAMTWTPGQQQGVVPPPNIGNAKTVRILNPPRWYLPTDRINPQGTQQDVESPGFDVLGRDLPLADLQAAQQGGQSGGAWSTGLMFCTNVRITPLTQAQDLLRAEVRVFWPRQLNTALDPNVCTQDPPASWDADDPSAVAAYHFVYLTSAIRQNISPQ
jgi:type IV pilus assembly protein PilV